MSDTKKQENITPLDQKPCSFCGKAGCFASCIVEPTKKQEELKPSHRTIERLRERTNYWLDADHDQTRLVFSAAEMHDALNRRQPDSPICPYCSKPVEANYCHVECREKRLAKLDSRGEENWFADAVDLCEKCEEMKGDTICPGRVIKDPKSCSGFKPTDTPAEDKGKRKCYSVEDHDAQAIEELKIELEAEKLAGEIAEEVSLHFKAKFETAEKEISDLRTIINNHIETNADLQAKLGAAHGAWEEAEVKLADKKKESDRWRDCYVEAVAEKDKQTGELEASLGVYMDRLGILEEKLVGAEKSEQYLREKYHACYASRQKANKRIEELENCEECETFYVCELRNVRKKLKATETVVAKVPALIQQLDMSNWEEQDTGVGHTVKNLKALLELKEVMKGVTDGKDG